MLFSFMLLVKFIPFSLFMRVGGKSIDNNIYIHFFKGGQVEHSYSWSTVWERYCSSCCFTMAEDHMVSLI